EALHCKTDQRVQDFQNRKLDGSKMWDDSTFVVFGCNCLILWLYVIAFLSL
ncbi:hypothetical protein FRX31_019658, partial [Thalictrum thalictroides]